MGRRLPYVAVVAAIISPMCGAGHTWAQSAYAPPTPAQHVQASGLVLADQAPTTTASPVTDTAAAENPGTRCSRPILNAIGGHGHRGRDAFGSNQPLGCWAHHNMFGCGSLKSECTFIFGSCRAFYGQLCLKEPPPDALAPMREGTPDAAPPPRARLPFTWCPSCR
jgi:hypothetical protein